MLHEHKPKKEKVFSTTVRFELTHALRTALAGLRMLVVKLKILSEKLKMLKLRC
jgi:hypothetical protein